MSPAFTFYRAVVAHLSAGILPLITGYENAHCYAAGGDVSRIQYRTIGHGQKDCLGLDIKAAPRF